MGAAAGPGALRGAGPEPGGAAGGLRVLTPFLSCHLLSCFVSFFSFILYPLKEKKKAKTLPGARQCRGGRAASAGAQNGRAGAGGLAVGWLVPGGQNPAYFSPKRCPTASPMGFSGVEPPLAQAAPGPCAFVPPPAGARGRTSAEGCPGPLTVPSASPVSNWDKLGQTGPRGGRPCLLLAAGSALCPHVLARGRQRAGLWPRPGTAACCRGGSRGRFFQLHPNFVVFLPSSARL